jgi:hypothetical protein
MMPRWETVGRTSRRIGAAVAVAAGLLTAGTAYGDPFIEIVGGGAETQGAGWTIIPSGAFGVENVTSAISMMVRSPGAPAGTNVLIRFDYIGSDAAFTNLFTGGSVTPGLGTANWCNQGAACTYNTHSFAGLGLNGPPANSAVWFTQPYAQTAYINVPIDTLIPFVFVADVLNQGGNGTHEVADGTQGSFATAHFGLFNISSGAFDFASYNSQGRVWALGLTDGNVSEADDDHQDFMVRVAVASEPGTLAILALGLFALAAVRRRAA